MLKFCAVCLIIFTSCAQDVSEVFDDPAVEMLKQNFTAGDLQKFIRCDAETWTRYLSGFAFFGAKSNLIPRGQDDSAIDSIHQVIYWKSYRGWKTIDWPSMKPIQDKFVECMGYTPTLEAVPDGGLGFIPANVTYSTNYEKKNHDVLPFFQPN